MYIHQLKAWPALTYKYEKVVNLLAEVRLAQGRLLGRMEEMGFSLREEATLQALTQDAVKTSEIEGEKLNYEEVRSSLARRLGIKISKPLPAHRDVDGIVEVLLDATRQYQTPLTSERLFNWHAALFSSDTMLSPITIGNWRNKKSGPMQVVSGPIGHEKIHFEAPSFDRLKKEMKVFLEWFNSTTELDLVIKAAIAHFWFVTIHPFDDGNGRLARAIADMVLARSENSSQRFYSMSSQIRIERKAYYDILEKCQRGTVDITAWVEWFLGCLLRAIQASEELLQKILSKARFWQKHNANSFNERQRKVIGRLLEGLQGKLTSSKWASLAKCSQDTALRDINDLLAQKILVKAESGGRSTSYTLKSSE